MVSRRDRAVRVGPLRARAAQQADAVAGLDAQIDQPAADLADDLADLRERRVAPLVAGLVADGDAIGIQLCRLGQQVGVPCVGAVPASIALLL